MSQTDGADPVKPDDHDDSDDLLERLRRGENAARRDLFERFDAKLRAHFARTLLDRSEAEDCASEVIISALEGIANGAQPQHLEKWLWGIARHVAYDRYSANKRRDDRALEDLAPELFAVEGEAPAEEVVSAVGQQEAFAAIKIVLPRLPLVQRQVLTAHLNLSLRAKAEVKGAALAAALGEGWSDTRVNRELERARDGVKQHVGVLGVFRTAQACPSAMALAGAGPAGSASHLTDKQWALLAKHAASCSQCHPVYQESQRRGAWALGPGLILLAAAWHGSDHRLTLAADVTPAASDPVPLVEPTPSRRRSRTPLWLVTAVLMAALVVVVLQLARPYGRNDALPTGNGPVAQLPVTGPDDDPGLPDPAQPPTNAQPDPTVTVGTAQGGPVPHPAPPPAPPAIPAGFTSLGGTVTSAPVAVQRRGSGMDLFARGPDGSLWHEYSFNGRDWAGGFESLGGYIIGAPAAVSAESDGLDVFAIGADHTLYHMSYDSTQNTFGNWVSMGAPPGHTIVSAPAAASWDVGRIDLAVVTDDGSIAGQYFQNGAWSGWWTMPGKAGATSIAEGTWGPGRLDVMFLDTDDELWSRYYEGNWSGLGNQSAAGLNPHLNPSTKPALGSRGTGMLDIFALDTAGALRSRSWASGAWSSWTDNSGSWLYGPAAASPGCGGLYLFLVGPDKSIYEDIWVEPTNCG
jgi:DNA-directed RNA polymerase specialized sigma24 family protein